MNVYEAIMRAGDHIERHPDLFKFSRFCIPKRGSPGCALGWIGHFAGMEAAYTGAGMRVPKEVLGLDGDTTFYQLMGKLSGGGGWRYDAEICARTLRAYAAKHHKPTTRTDSEFVAALVSRLTQPVSEAKSEELT
jgi:hypothetical protein